MHIGRFKPLAAALLLSGAAAAQASVGPEISFSCSDTLSINDVGGLQVGCSGDLLVFGNGPDSVLAHPNAIVLRASASLRLEDLRIISPQITLDAPQLQVSQGVSLEASGPSDGQSSAKPLRVDGDVRLEAGQDPNRVARTMPTPGGVVMSVNFSGVIFGSSFNSSINLSSGPSSISGQVSGAFFGTAGTSSGVIDLTRPGIVAASEAGPYAAPFLPSKSVAGTLSPVPEPSTSALLLGGLGLMAFVRRRGARA